MARLIMHWDTLMIIACKMWHNDLTQKSYTQKILTEDLNSGQVIEGVLIQNPFLENEDVSISETLE